MSVTVVCCVSVCFLCLIFSAGNWNREQGAGTRDQGPGTRDQGPGTRDRGQGTGDRGQGTGDRGQGTGNRDRKKDLYSLKCALPKRNYRTRFCEEWRDKLACSTSVVAGKTKTTHEQ